MRSVHRLETLDFDNTICYNSLYVVVEVCHAGIFRIGDHSKKQYRVHKGRQNKENRYEKNLPTQEKTKKQGARISRKNENHRRTQNACKTQKQGSPLPFRIGPTRLGNYFEVLLQT